MNIGKDPDNISGVRMIPLIEPGELQSGRLLTGPAWNAIWRIEDVRRSTVVIKVLAPDEGAVAPLKTIAFQALLPKTNWPSTPRVWILVPAGELIKVSVNQRSAWITLGRELGLEMSAMTLPILPRVRKAWELPEALVELRDALARQAR